MRRGNELNQFKKKQEVYHYVLKSECHVSLHRVVYRGTCRWLLLHFLQSQVLFNDTICSARGLEGAKKVNNDYCIKILTGIKIENRVFLLNL